MSALDQLTAEQEADVKKMSSDRIRMVLTRAGGDIDALAQANRQELMEEMAKYLLSEQQGAASDEDMEKLTLSERHLMLLERQMRFQEEQAARQLRLQEEQAERQLRFQEEQAERQLRLQEQRLELDRQKHALERERQCSLAARVKFYGDALKFSTVRMTDEPGDLPHFFTSLENVFDMYEVPHDLRAKLTIPLLTSKAKTLLSRLPVDKLAKYTEVRDFLLCEFHLTSEQYRDRFLTTERKSDETFTLFCSRLRSLFRYYLDSRNVGDNFDKLVSLMVADRLKTEMSASCLKHILAIETAGEWLGCDKLADAADTYMHSHFADGEPRMLAGRGRPVVSTARPENNRYTGNRDKPGYGTRPLNTGVQASARPDSTYRPSTIATSGDARVKHCYQCGSPDHLASFHRRPAVGPTTGNGRGEVRPVSRPLARPGNAGNARVNRCAVIRDDPAIWSLRRYRNLIFGSKITCYCDNNPLLYITEGVTSSAKLLRWSLALQQFDVSFKYRPGRQNIVADCLSRLCD